MIRVGFGVVIVKDGKILLGTRIGSHGAEEKAVPGGHLEYAERFVVGITREVEEETGMKIFIRTFDPHRLDWFVTEHMIEDKHYIGLFFVADWASGEPINKEPHKNKGWHWVTYDELLQYAKPGSHWLPSEFFENYRDRILKG